jgi:spectinomycin phosphotransferase
VAVPKFLNDQGIVQIIAPLATQTGQLWGSVDGFKMILYPFVEGHDGFEVDLLDQQWVDFGVSLKGIHAAVVPPTLTKHIQHETYSAQGREIVKTFLERVENDAFGDPIAVKLAAFLKTRCDEIHDLVGRAERLAQALQVRSQEFVLCHSDIHAGNILIGTNGALYIVDWDDPILAPKERDLMFVSGGVGGVWHKAREAALFYQGYGQTEIDPVALAYYRYERIIQDIVVTCEQIFLTGEGGEHREKELGHFFNQFLPDNVVEIAYKSEENLPPELRSGCVRR